MVPVLGENGITLLALSVNLVNANLLIQVIAFAVVLVSLFYKNKKHYKLHGGLMGAAVALNIASFLVVMQPSFNNNFEHLTTMTSELSVLTTWIHIVTGVAAMIAALVLVVVWALHPSDVSGCFKRKRLMDFTILFWLVSLIFGVAIYILVYS